MIISLSNLNYAYTKGHSALVVPSLRIQEGEKIALVGRNGSGKSTLLHCMAGVFNTDKNVRNCNVDPEKISLVFQSPCLDKKLTVRENLVLFGRVWGLKEHIIDSQISALSSLLELAELLERTVGSLSGGQQRRADLARALLSSPQLLFLDEPTSGLDVLAQREFWRVLSRAKEANPKLTLVCASHHAAELSLFERFVFLDQGHMCLDISRVELLTQLPAETLEISTMDVKHLAAELNRKIALPILESIDNRILLHTENATRTLTELHSFAEFLPLLESTTVRRTNLADAVWKKLSDLAENNIAPRSLGMGR